MDTGPFTGGKLVFAENRCARCHTINNVRLVARGGERRGGPPGERGGPPMGGTPGEGRPGMGPGGPGGPGRNRGPDLGKVGQDPNHTVEWLMEQVRDPKSHKPDSKMPANQNLPDDQLHSLAEYLKSLQG
jgi:mono/diheme cytochrome c family protein